MKKWMNFLNRHKGKIDKYFLTIVVFLVVTFFIGDNYFLDGFQYETRINSLKKEIASLKEDNEKKHNQLDALLGDKESLEQFAREQFQMTKPNEDLFLIAE